MSATATSVSLSLLRPARSETTKYSVFDGLLKSCERADVNGEKVAETEFGFFIGAAQTGIPAECHNNAGETDPQFSR